ncbi:MAG: hypothetical protein NUW37_01530 [Planctomycetes bacterium]|nr:hypothetical protein [Planctomycetota bacterium]
MKQSIKFIDTFSQKTLTLKLPVSKTLKEVLVFLRKNYPHLQSKDVIFYVDSSEVDKNLTLEDLIKGKLLRDDSAIFLTEPKNTPVSVSESGHNLIPVRAASDSPEESLPEVFEPRAVSRSDGLADALSGLDDDEDSTGSADVPSAHTRREDSDFGPPSGVEYRAKEADGLADALSGLDDDEDSPGSADVPSAHTRREDSDFGPPSGAEYRAKEADGLADALSGLDDEDVAPEKPYRAAPPPKPERHRFHDDDYELPDIEEPELPHSSGFAESTQSGGFEEEIPESLDNEHDDTFEEALDDADADEEMDSDFEALMSESARVRASEEPVISFRAPVEDDDLFDTESFATDMGARMSAAGELEDDEDLDEEEEADFRVSERMDESAISDDEEPEESVREEEEEAAQDLLDEADTSAFFSEVRREEEPGNGTSADSDVYPSESDDPLSAISKEMEIDGVARFESDDLLGIDDEFVDLLDESAARRQSDAWAKPDMLETDTAEWSIPKVGDISGLESSRSTSRDSSAELDMKRWKEAKLKSAREKVSLSTPLTLEDEEIDNMLTEVPEEEVSQPEGEQEFETSEVELRETLAAHSAEIDDDFESASDTLFANVPGVAKMEPETASDFEKRSIFDFSESTDTDPEIPIDEMEMMLNASPAPEPAPRARAQPSPAAAPSVTRAGGGLPAPVPPAPKIQQAPPGQPAHLRRKTTIRYFKQMSPGKTFPLVAVISKETIAKVALRDVSHAEGKEFAIAKDKPRVEVKVHFPGCITVPATQLVDVSPERVEMQFYLTPMAAGDLPDANVEIWHEGRMIERIQTPATIARPTWAKVSIACAVLFPVLTFLTNVFRNKVDLVVNRLSDVGDLIANNVSTQVWSGAGVFLVFGLLFFGLSKPREAPLVHRIIDSE